MRTVTRRLLPLLLVSLMLVGMFAACANTTTPPADTKETTATTNGGGIIIDPDDGTTEDDVDPYYGKYTKDDLPEDLNYGDKAFTILCDMDQYRKSFVETDTGDTIGSALYSRAERVQERLGVSLNVERFNGGYSEMASFT